MKRNGSHAHNNYKFAHLSARLTAVHAEPVQLPSAHLYLPVSIVNHARLYVEGKEAGIEKIPKPSNRKS